MPVLQYDSLKANGVLPVNGADSTTSMEEHRSELKRSVC